MSVSKAEDPKAFGEAIDRAMERARNRESGIGSRESGNKTGNRESGIGNRQHSLPYRLPTPDSPLPFSSLHDSLLP
ncbi:MAG: hypothetical protein ACRDEA_07290, partial [Microcystaceae cyanobacterium]